MDAIVRLEGQKDYVYCVVLDKSDEMMRVREFSDQRNPRVVEVSSSQVIPLLDGTKELKKGTKVYSKWYDDKEQKYCIPYYSAVLGGDYVPGVSYVVQVVFETKQKQVVQFVDVRSLALSD